MAEVRKVIGGIGRFTDEDVKEVVAALNIDPKTERVGVLSGNEDEPYAVIVRKKLPEPRKPRKTRATILEFRRKIQ